MYPNARRRPWLRAARGNFVHHPDLTVDSFDRLRTDLSRVRGEGLWGTDPQRFVVLPHPDLTVDPPACGERV